MKKIAKEDLLQLQMLLNKIDSSHYTKKLDVLSGASVGEHMRHILEFYLLLISGSFVGVVNYDKRERNIKIQSEPAYAIQIINKIFDGLATLKESELIQFEGDYSIAGGHKLPVKSSIGRELSYCIEHSIHHQALIKAGLFSLNLQHITSNQFGVAYSTMRYRTIESKTHN